MGSACSFDNGNLSSMFFLLIKKKKNVYKNKAKLNALLTKIKKLFSIAWIFLFK